jgi:energy-coupling factor transport system ATP-binding protein
MLELKNVFVTYDPNTIFTSDALVDISLKIKKNESVGIVGRIGSGKSTLIQLFNGLIKPDKGIVLLDNH